MDVLFVNSNLRAKNEESTMKFNSVPKGARLLRITPINYIFTKVLLLTVLKTLLLRALNRQNKHRNKTKWQQFYEILFHFR